MTYPEIKIIVNVNLCNYFLQNGFFIKKKTEGFLIYKNTDFGKQLITIDIGNYKIEFSNSASFAVAYNKVSEILYSGRNLGENINSDFSFTLIENPNEKYYDLLNHFQVKSELNLIKWCKMVIEYYKEFGNPFFKSYNNLNDLDIELNSHPSTPNTLLNHPTFRAETAIVVAKLNNNKNYEQLIKIYRNELTKTDSLYEYENVVEYLKTLKN